MRVDRAFFVLACLCLLLTVICSGELSAANGVAVANVKGQLFAAGVPLAQARVAIFRAVSECLPDARGVNRVPEAIAITGSNGEFNFAISPGEYFLGATGPSSLPTDAMMLDSKNFFLALEKNGAIRSFSFAIGRENNLGSLLMTANQRKRSSEDCFVVRGIVRDAEDQPISGMIVLAKETFNDLWPSFVSFPTDVAGRYEIYLAPGSYVLIARRQDSSFGRPAPGELLGIYGEDKSVGVGGVFLTEEDPKRVVEGGAGENIAVRDIAVFVIPDPEKIKLERQEQ